MNYKYAVNCNNEDFASGRVLYHAGGATNFPVRLANEIYRRCLEYSDKKKNICLYDCCCGGGYLVTVLGFLNQQSISKIVASDIDSKMVDIARRNLSLLSKIGILQRKDEIHSLYEQYHKASHSEAEISADQLSGMLVKDMDIHVFQANALECIRMDLKPDIIITDVPYGNLVSWQSGTDGLNSLMDSLKNICSKDTILAICMDKKQKVEKSSFLRLEKQLIGKRKFEIYRLANEVSEIKS